MGASGGGFVSVTFTVVVPIVTNAVDVKKGEELFLESTRNKETKRKEGSWKDDVAKAANAPKRKLKLLPRWNSLPRSEQSRSRG